MRKLILAVPFALALVTATVIPSLAAVNCDIVNKELKLGRWPEDIALSRGITLADVRDCRDEVNGATTPPPQAGPGRSSATAYATKRPDK